MYSLADFIDLSPGNLPDLNQLVILKEQKLLDPFSLCLAEVLTSVVETNTYPLRSKTLKKLLLLYHETDSRILSPEHSYDNLTKGEAVCLYLTYLMENFPAEQIQHLLQDKLDFVRTYVFYDPEVIDRLDEDQKRLFLSDWTSDAKVLLLPISNDNLPSIRYQDVFYYHVGSVQTISEDLFETLQRDVKIITQSVQELIDIVRSEKGRNSHGIMHAAETGFIQFLRGWTFMNTYPASYSDYKELNPHEEYPAEVITYMPTTLSNTVNSGSLKGTELNVLFQFLSHEGFADSVIPVIEPSAMLADERYRVLSIQAADSHVVKDLVTKEDNFDYKPSYWLQKHFNTKDTKRILMIVATWDVFFIQQIPESLTSLLDTVIRFYRGIAVANTMTAYGYLVYAIDLIEQEDRFKLVNVSLTDSPLTNDYYEWITANCILPICAPDICRLVEVEFLSSLRVKQQFQEMVSDPEKMRYIGKGSLWDEKKVEELFVQSYLDTLKAERIRDYFNWFLIDNNENLLAYVSIRAYASKYMQIRVISRIEGHGYGKRAVYLAHNQYYLRTDRKEMYAVVDSVNKASLRLFDSMFPIWQRKESKSRNSVTFFSDGIDEVKKVMSI